MTDECIHGFERELCDICAPRKREPLLDADGAGPDAVTKRRAASRKPESLRSTPALARDSAAVAVAAQSAARAGRLASRGQRVYHWTHVIEPARHRCRGRVSRAEVAAGPSSTSAPRRRAPSAAA